MATEIPLEGGSEQLSQKSFKQILEDIQKDGKLDGKDIASIKELQKRFEIDKAELTSQIKADLLKAKEEMLVNGFTISNIDDYNVFVSLAKMSNQGDNFPSYEEVLKNTKPTYENGKKISVYLESGKLWAYNFNDGYYGWFDTKNGKLETNLGFSVGIAEFKTSDNNDIRLSNDTLGKAEFRDKQISELKTKIEEAFALLKSPAISDKIAKLIELTEFINKLKNFGYPVTSYERSMSGLRIDNNIEKNQLKWNDSTPLNFSENKNIQKNLKQVLGKDYKIPSQKDITAFLEKHEKDNFLKRGEVVDSKDATQTIYAVQVALSKMGIDVGNIDGMLGVKTKEGVREFQKKIGLEEGNIDGIPGAITISRILTAMRKNQESVPVA